MNVQRWLRLVALPSVLASLVVAGTSLVAAVASVDAAPAAATSGGLARGRVLSDLGQADLTGRTSVTGTVTGVNSTSEPPIVFLQTAEGDVRVSIMERRLLALVQIGGTMTLTGQASGPTQFMATGYLPTTPAAPSALAQVPAPPIARATPDLSGLLVGVDTFATPAVGQVRTDDGTIWFITVRNAELLRSMPMGRTVNLLGRKIGGVVFEVTDVLLS